MPGRKQRARFLNGAVIAAALAAGPVALLPGQNAPPPATRPATGSAPATRPPITLDFKKVPLDAVLDHLSEAAGFSVIKEANVDERITLVVRQPVSADEAITLLNAALKNHGVTAVQQGRVLKILGRETAKKSNLPVHFGADPNEIPLTDDLITQVIPIRNVDALKLRTDLTPLLPTDADVAANGGSNAIIVTDTSANIHRVVEIVAALDRNETANAELRRYELKNANATATAKLILQIYKPPPDPRQQDGKNRPDEQLRARINAVADDRTNILFVSAPAEIFKAVEEMLKALEANATAATEIKVFTPKFADASAAAKLITSIFRPDDVSSRAEAMIRYQMAQGGQMSLDQALKARVVAAADDKSNTLVVTAPGETMKIIEDVLKHMDVDPSSVTELKVIPLQYADAASVVKVITSVFKPDDTAAKPVVPQGEGRRPQAPDQPLHARVNIASDDRLNALVLSAPKETIKVIEDMLKILDANPASASVTKIYQLKNADAWSAVSLINSIYKGDDLATSALSSPRGAAGPSTPESISAAERARRNRINAASDSRTNSLVISAPPEMLADIEQLITRLDSNPASEETFFIYRLKNGQAGNVEQVLNNLFGTQSPQQQLNGPNASGRNARSGSRGAAAGNVNPALAAFGGAAGFNSRGGGTGIGSRRGSSQVGGFGVGNGMFPPGYGNVGNMQQGQLPQGMMRAVTELTGEVYVVADLDTNSLLVTTATKYSERVKRIIEELDRAVPQVLIKVLVCEVTHDDSIDLGVDFSVINRRPNGQGTSISSAFGNAAQNTGLVVSMLEDKLNAQLHVLATSGKLDVLSRPYILASDNQLASITVGQEVPFITNSRTTDLGQTINTIEYQDVGIILNVTPHINPDGLVIMDVAPEISQLTGTTVQISQNASAPVIAKRSAESRVGVRNGHTIVIGGLMEDRKTSTVLKIPILGDIPLLGAIFTRTQVTKSKTELLIFLTPHVAQQPEFLQGATEQERQGLLLTPRSVGPGKFDEHMKGMERGDMPMSRPSAVDPLIGK
jgi:type II secretion system protein D